MYGDEQHNAIRPHEFQTVQDVFKKVSSEAWFSRDPERQQKFGAFLIRAFQGGVVDSASLYDLALRTARERFVETKNLH